MELDWGCCSYALELKGCKEGSVTVTGRDGLVAYDVRVPGRVNERMHDRRMVADLLRDEMVVA